MAKMADAVNKLAAKSGGGARLVDTRGIGRPSNFGTGEEKVLEKTFPIWQRKLQNYVVSVYPDLQPAMEWAVMQGSPITDADIDDAYGNAADALDQISDVQDKDHQLYSVLIQVTEGEANDIVCNSRGSGLEAWRKLTRRWDPLTGGRVRNLLRFVISPGRAKMEELHGVLERWEEQVSKYCNSKDRSGAPRVLPEDIKMAALESLVPVDIEAHLQMNASKFDTYDKMRHEVVAYLEARTGTRMRETRVTKHDATRDRDAMDVDSLTRRRTQVSLPSGGDLQSTKFTGQCHHCGKIGHKAADCWHAQAKGAKGGKGPNGKSGKSNLSGASGANAGFTNGKGKSKLNFYEKGGKSTGKYDNRKGGWKGKKPKAAGSLEEEEPERE